MPTPSTPPRCGSTRPHARGPLPAPPPPPVNSLLLGALLRVASPLPFKLETQSKRCPHRSSPGQVSTLTWPWAGCPGPLPSLMCPGRGWNFSLLTSDDSEPYFPKEAKEERGSWEAFPSPRPPGMVGCVTGISCPLPILPAPPGATILPQACWWPPLASHRLGLAPAPALPAVIPGPCPCLSLLSLWPDWKQKMTKSVFFF